MVDTSDSSNLVLLHSVLNLLSDIWNLFCHSDFVIWNFIAIPHSGLEIVSQINQRRRQPERFVEFFQRNPGGE